MTLIEVHNSDGLVGRCDAHCHEARQPDCRCVCGGRNHGVGPAQALANTRQLGEQMIGEYLKARPGATARITDAVLQGALDL